MTSAAAARWLTGLLLLASAGCNETATRSAASDAVDPIALGQAFVSDRALRRALLEESIVEPTNSYSVLRLDRYATESPDGVPTNWDARDEWNPPVRPWMGDGAPASVAPAAVFDRVEWTHDGLMALGRSAFESYPLSLEEAAEDVATRPAEAFASGLWLDDRGRLGGLVEVTLDDGRTRIGTTCATCHARPDQTGALEHGVANQAYDLGELLAARARDPEARAILASWGPGRVDVTPANVDPAAISDLRPLRYQRHLHWAATLDNSLGALAVRVDTLITTSLAGARPPREVSFALAYYLWNLEPRAARRVADVPPATYERGAAVFEAVCETCHGDGLTPQPAVPYERVNTDPLLAQSPDRGTGRWRVPSLAGVSTRGRLMHDGSIDDLAHLLDPERLFSSAPGHIFGLDRSAEDRAALLAFLETLGD